MNILTVFLLIIHIYYLHKDGVFLELYKSQLTLYKARKTGDNII